MSSSTKQVTARVLEHTRLSDSAFTLVLDAPEIAVLANPGQFVHVLCGGSYDPLLRRPLSIYRAEPDSGKLAMLYEVRGRGTALLAEKKPGDFVDVLGPLGNGFVLPKSSDQSILLVGGGIGAPPLYFLAQRIAERVGRSCMTFHMGAQTQDKHVCMDDFHSLCEGSRVQNKYFIATDDGSCGHHGFVTHSMKTHLAEVAWMAPMVYACGPIPMLRAVAGIAKEYGAQCQVSLEAKMACGVGACMGCVIRVRDGDGSKYVRVCHEGPVFDAEEVIWE